MKYLSILILAVAGMCVGVNASERVRVNVGVGFGFHFSPRPYCVDDHCSRVVTVYETGHYETRIERVIIAPAVSTRRWIPETVQEIKNSDGSISRTVIPGRFEEMTVPALYEDRTYQVWVRG